MFCRSASCGCFVLSEMETGNRVVDNCHCLAITHGSIELRAAVRTGHGSLMVAQVVIELGLCVEDGCCFGRIVDVLVGNLSLLAISRCLLEQSLAQ